jgi:hypothetical protein
VRDGVRDLLGEAFAAEVFVVVARPAGQRG